MDPASTLLILKGLLDLLPLAMKNVQIFQARGEYTPEEWAAVKAKAQGWATDPAWQEEPDPTTTAKKKP